MFGKMWEKKGAIEDCIVVGGLLAMQFVYAANSVLLGYLMSMGINPLSLIIFTAFSTFLVLSPLCLYFERGKWPEKLSSKLTIQLVLIAFGGNKGFLPSVILPRPNFSKIIRALTFYKIGVTLFQLLFLKGIQLTSPTMATAMPNLAPGLIFVIAWAFRLEKVRLGCIYSKAKIVGTSFCVIGAISMSILQSTMVKHAGELSSSPPPVLFDKQKLCGSMYLMAAVLVLSSNIVLQATTLGEFPAPMSLCAITSLIGAVITALLEIIREHKFEYGWPIVSFKDLFGYSLLGGTVTGICISFNGWAMKKKGPVFVSMFSPVGTVCSLVLSVITLGEYINLASLLSMLFVFAGLYLVLWAKGKEGYPCDDDWESEYDAEKPLLS